MSNYIDRIEIYKDNADEWRWQAVSHNNKVVGDSGEGYKNKTDAKNSAEQMFPSVRIVEDG